MMEENTKIEVADVDNGSEKFMNSVHRDGTIWNLAVMAIFLLFPVVVGLIFKAVPNWSHLGQGLLFTAPMYWAVGIVEVITYVPMLGAGGSYLAFVTGNISNLKLPCALNALESNSVDAKSEEGEIVSTIAIAVSSIVTIVILIIGVSLLGLMRPILENEALTPAFDQLLPALFGALGVVFISKNWKIAIAPIALMLILFVFVPAIDTSMVGIMVPVGVLFTIGVSFLMYKKGWL